MKKDDLIAEIKGASLTERSATGREWKVITLIEEKRISKATSIPLRELELTALEIGVTPKRYIKNIGTIGIEGQRKLLSEKVAVVGAGGLGGFILELLARAGVGRITVIDGDLFEESNLNRQLFSLEENLGSKKVEMVKQRVAKVNAAVEITAVFDFLKNKGAEIISKSAVVCDALDNISSRRTLGKISRQLNIPLVHGAVAGFSVQVATIFPDDPGFELIYGEQGELDRGEEEMSGNLPATAAAVASFQVQEVIKIITGKGETLKGKLLILDTENWTAETIPLSKRS
jgi:molybdopterin/thiamine biosynthesis adenylyltransferase